MHHDELRNEIYRDLIWNFHQILVILSNYIEIEEHDCLLKIASQKKWRLQHHNKHCNLHQLCIL